MPEGACNRSTVFEKLGGKENVQAAVELFYQKIQADPLTAPFFEGIDMKKQKAKQLQFMALAFGGPNDYKGRSMGAAHAGLDLNDAHFDAVAGHFVSTLRELGVDAAVVDEAAAVVMTTRPEVLGKGAQ
ncbi:MAG: hypothetical protein J3K34DRAFT_466299 [Monoraphidium minutum]|nr:MAG: hypothetical protein J3K34DRAFT_466299 [Monoraphidium minutum]